MTFQKEEGRKIERTKTGLTPFQALLMEAAKFSAVCIFGGHGVELKQEKNLRVMLKAFFNPYRFLIKSGRPTARFANGRGFLFL
ncbi:MAG: hypothetical protein M1470_02940 [Bacteroidetes bacterium]|nr:hypothetical protein [Bacteroidota bacterium]MCL5739233.1 hypothetical protein [Bacteroidota bacterium]